MFTMGREHSRLPVILATMPFIIKSSKNSSGLLISIAVAQSLFLPSSFPARYPLRKRSTGEIPCVASGTCEELRCAIDEIFSSAARQRTQCI